MSVLMIEDNPDIAEMYKLKLELDGYRVTVAPSGEDGLDQVGQQLPDLLFLDIGLPKMDGLAVLGQLRTNVKTMHIPVVLLTAYDEQELKERGLKLGAVDYLIKSVTTPTSLSRRVEDWASRRQLAGV
ncbi:MAG TPA: response regulator [Candidatus Dormibacteraeota bacterium]